MEEEGGNRTRIWGPKTFLCIFVSHSSPFGHVYLCVFGNIYYYMHVLTRRKPVTKRKWLNIFFEISPSNSPLPHTPLFISLGPAGRDL